MYNDYFGFSESPFNITPNPRFYYHTQSCDEVLAVIRHGIETRKGLIVIVGEPGSGKTLFLKSLVRDLAPKANTVFVPNPHADLDELLRLLIERLNLHGPLDDRTARLDRLADHLIEQRREGRIVCLLIDEAQDLQTHALDELRVLANLEFEGDALLPIVLAGQPELNLKLDHPSAIRIKQRVALTRGLYPLIRKEVGPYIDFRVKIAGYEKSGLFDAEAISAIAAHSGGVPRMVNAICDNSLFKAYTTNQTVIPAHIVDQVARELRINAPVSLQKQLSRAAFQPGAQDKSESPGHQTERRSALFELDNTGPAAFQESWDPHVLGTPDEIGEPTKMARKSAPDAGSGTLHGFLPGRLRWYASASAVVLLLIALNIVNSSQLAGIYSTLSGKTRTNMGDGSSTPTSDSHSREDVKPGPSSELAAMKQEPAATDKSGDEKAKDISEGHSKPAQSKDPPAPGDADPQAQSASASVPKKNESKPAAVTMEVVALSKVRAQPNDQSEIIAELEPGNRVTVLAKSRDYFHVRSVDDKTIRGYVHREDAFFESATRR